MRANYTTVNGQTANIEVMHSGTSPRFKTNAGNLSAAYEDLKNAGGRPRLFGKGTIDVVYPWTDVGHEELLSWFDVQETL